MPNGKPGDHPITDVVVHGKDVFTPEMDALIAEIDASASEESGADAFGPDLNALLMRAQWDRSLWPELRDKLAERAAELRRS